MSHAKHMPAAGSTRSRDTILMIGTDGNAVCDLLTVYIDETSRKIMLRPLKPLFSEQSDGSCPEATAFFRSGGAPLLMSAASGRLGYTLEKYVLFAYPDIIRAADRFGGLDMGLHDSEPGPLEEQIGRLCGAMGLNAAENRLEQVRPGVWHLNGLQLVAFLKLSDLRDDGPDRVRRILSALKSAVKKTDLRTLAGLAKLALSCVRTNIPAAALLAKLLNVREYARYDAETC